MLKPSKKYWQGMALALGGLLLVALLLLIFLAYQMPGLSANLLGLSFCA